MSMLPAIVWKPIVVGFSIPLPDFNHPFPSLTAEIYYRVHDPDDNTIRQGWALGMLVLISIILVLNAAVRFVSRKKRGQT